jgi:hypothetical protein
VVGPVHDGELGEVSSLHVSLDTANQKLTQMRKIRAPTTTTDDFRCPPDGGRLIFNHACEPVS